MNPHRVKKKMLCSRSLVGFKSNARDVLKDPSIAIYLNRYNSQSTVRMISLKILLTTCVIRDPMDLDFT